VVTTATHPAYRTAAAQLRAHAPALVAPFEEALPRAADTVARRLVGALHREGLAPWTGPGARHAFNRVEPVLDRPHDPAELVADRGLADELASAVVGLALAYARPVPPPERPDDADAAALDRERRAVDGHNLHPCGRTRLGWDVADTLAHDVEAGRTAVGFVAVHRGLHTGDDLGAALRATHPGVPAAPPGFIAQPVHAWERTAVLRRRHAALYRTGALRDLDGELPAAPTAALRTLLLPPGADGRRRYVKVALDIQVTSTRRTISTASTRNGPVLSALLHRLVAEHDRVLLLAETHGAALTAGDGRDASAILRDGLPPLAPGETAVPGGALTVGPVLDPLVAAHPGGPAGFLGDYARLLLPPVVALAARYGIGLEAHLQNCLPTFKDGRPHRIVFRDFAGLRLHPGRLAAAGHDVALWPGSVVVTGDVDVVRAKVAYTALQAHLGELVIRLDLDEAEAWREIRAALDEAYEPLRGGDARADHAFLTAPRVPHKALVRMRLHRGSAGSGDVYVPVENPLHAAA
jgi:D-ornithine---citrate ligase